MDDLNCFIAGTGLGVLCRRRAIEYKLSRKPFGVFVADKHLSTLKTLIEEREQREQEKEQRKREKEERAKEEQRKHEERVAKVKADFPKLANSDVDRCVTALKASRLYMALDDVPLDFLTKEELDELKLLPLKKVEAAPLLVTEEGATVTELFRAKLPKEEVAVASSKVHAEAVERGFSPQRALWAANKLVKIIDAKHVSKSELYGFKNRLLNHWSQYCVESRIARDESKECWTCDGMGFDFSGDECDRCDGTGFYICRVLYEARYRFPGDEKTYCFHTYDKPPKLSDEKGADKPSYGFRFSKAERSSIPFDFHQLLRFLRHETKRLDQIAEEEALAKWKQRWQEAGLPPLKEWVKVGRIQQVLRDIEAIAAVQAV